MKETKEKESRGGGVGFDAGRSTTATRDKDQESERLQPPDDIESEKAKPEMAKVQNFASSIPVLQQTVNVDKSKDEGEPLLSEETPIRSAEENMNVNAAAAQPPALSATDLHHAHSNNNAKYVDQSGKAVLRADYGPSSREGNSADGTDQQIQRLEQKTDMITGKMKNNLDELMKRDVALDDLEETAGGLAEDAKQFHTTSKKVNRKMWCRNHKWSFIIACAVIVVLVGVSLGVAGSMGAFK